MDGDAFVQAFGDAPPVYQCVALVINAVCPSVTGMKPQVEFVSALANHQPSVAVVCCIEIFQTLSGKSAGKP